MFNNLRLPVICAPMFLVSDCGLLSAACRNGIVGTLPAANARTSEELESWLQRIQADRERAEANGECFAPYGINIILHPNVRERSKTDLALCERFRVPLVITSVGDPTAVVKRVHDWGGRVIHDAITLRHAEKAAAAGVDGMVLVCAGAGGHGGHLNPFSFLPQVRAGFGGDLILAGGIGTGAAIKAALCLGADMVYMGTRFLAAREASIDPHYRELLLRCKSDDIIMTSAPTGIPANFMSASLREAGLDIDTLPQGRVIAKQQLPEGKKPWRDIWGAGHGVGMIDRIMPLAEIVAELEAEYREV